MLFSSGMMSGDINQSPYSRRHRKSSSENSEEDRVSIPGLTVKAVQLEHLGATCVEFFGKFCWYVQGSFKSQLDNARIVYSKRFSQTGNKFALLLPLTCILITTALSLTVSSWHRLTLTFGHPCLLPHNLLILLPQVDNIVFTVISTVTNGIITWWAVK